MDTFQIEIIVRSRNRGGPGIATSTIHTLIFHYILIPWFRIEFIEFSAGNHFKED